MGAPLIHMWFFSMIHKTTFNGTLDTVGSTVQGDEAVYWVVGQYIEKVEIWSGVTDPSHTD